MNVTLLVVGSSSSPPPNCRLTDKTYIKELFDQSNVDMPPGSAFLCPSYRAAPPFIHFSKTPVVQPATAPNTFAAAAAPVVGTNAVATVAGAGASAGPGAGAGPGPGSGAEPGPGAGAEAASTDDVYVRRTMEEAHKQQRRFRFAHSDGAMLSQPAVCSLSVLMGCREYLMVCVFLGHLILLPKLS